MKRVLILLTALIVVFLIFGCSETPKVTNPMDVSSLGALVPRPEFIETRPPEVVSQFILIPSPDVTFKKPPKPPPDTGGGDGGDDPNPNPAHKYAFIVGISDYEGTANDLEYCDDDAMDMRSMLQGEGFSVQVITDRNATADNIVDGLNWLVSVAAPGDEIAFCYSGHGVKVQGYGSSIISTDLYYIPHDYVMDIINSVNCSKKLVTLDACVIGDFLADGQDGSIVATASKTTYSYDAPDLHNGAWTYYFVEGAGIHDFAEDVATYAESGMKAWARVYHLRVSPAHTDKYTGMFDI